MNSPTPLHSVEQAQDFAALQAGNTCICFNLRRTSRLATRFYDRMLAPSGLKTTQFSILMALGAGGSSTLIPLADRLLLERTTLTRNLDLLERDGLVCTLAGEDRRERRLALTEQGRSALAAALPYWQQAQAVLANRLGNQHVQQLLDQLSEVVHALE